MGFGECMETTSSAITDFLALGSELLEWIITSMGSLITFLMETPVTAVFLVVGLIYVVVRIARRFINI